MCIENMIEGGKRLLFVAIVPAFINFTFFLKQFQVWKLLPEKPA